MGVPLNLFRLLKVPDITLNEAGHKQKNCFRKKHAVEPRCAEMDQLPLLFLHQAVDTL